MIAIVTGKLCLLQLAVEGFFLARFSSRKVKLLRELLNWLSRKKSDPRVWKCRLFLPQKCMLTSNEISIQTKLWTKITISKLRFKLVSISPTEIIYNLNCLLRQNITQRDCFKGFELYLQEWFGWRFSVVRACLYASLFLGLNALYRSITPPNN